MKENIQERMVQIDAKRKIADFQVKMQMDYTFKKRYAAIRAQEFATECEKRDLNYHVSVGGLDSITLMVFLRSIGIHAPGVSVSSLEDPSIQRVHRALGVERIKPLKRPDGGYYTKTNVIQEFGFPVLSKELATKIEFLQNPTSKNATIRHAIITGETGAYGGYQKNSRMKMSQKWLDKFGGYENENEGVNYGKPDFKVSAKCCYYLKERPCETWAKEHNSVPYLGLMASEGGRRAKALKMNGCNYFGKSTIRSAPFAIFSRQDLLALAIEMDAWYQKNWEAFGTGVKIDSIVPEIYGEIAKDEDGTLRTTKAQRTGCSMCGFGVHMEKSPNRFDQLKEKNPKEWEFLMYHMCKDENGGDYGWAKVLDYIGVPYEK